VVIDKVLGRFTSLKGRDYGSLYKLPDDYHIIELQVRKGDWVEERTLADCNVREEGITILGIDRSDGTYLGEPNSETMIFTNDTLILYGREGAIKKLDVRRKGKKGDKDHQEAVMKYTSKTGTS
jgi:K+/H+ antiporter YhaU regulatory subunit KhtT